jgi:hypothetical protein
MALARSRVRQRQDQGGEAGSSPVNAYVLLAMLVGLVGTVLVAIALYHHVSRRMESDDRARLARGFALLDELDDLACDYFYNGKDKLNNGRLPDEVWAPFRKHMEAGDLFDAVIMISYGREDRYGDACLYRDGKAAGGMNVNWELGRDRFFGPPGPAPEPRMGQVQVVEGSVVIGAQRAPVLFFRRPILHPKHGTDGWFGRAVIILHRNAPVAQPGAVAKSPPPAPAPAPTPAPTPAPPADPTKPAAPSGKT